MRGTIFFARNSVSVAIRLVLAFSGVSCIGPFAPCGSDVGRFGLDIGVVDDRTSAPPVTEVTAVVSDGQYADTVRSGQPPGRAVRLAAAPERPGTYTLTVSAAGYQSKTASNLSVQRGGRCEHLRTVSLNVRLQPAP